VINRFLVPVACVLAMAFAVACAKPLPVEPPLSVSPLAPDSHRRIIDSIVLVTDGSATMYKNKTFPAAKSLTQSFVKAMPEKSFPAANPENYNAGIIGFGGTERIVAPVAPFNRGNLAATADSLKIMGDIDGFGGETPYRHVLPEAAAAIGSFSGPKAAVIFSDGLPDYPERAVVAAGTLAETGACVHTVQTGNDPEGKAFLELVAGMSQCGSYRTADSIRDPGAFTTFVKEVMFEEYTSLCEGTIRLRGVNFAFDKSDITPDSAVVLDVAADTLRGCPSWLVSVEGNTDSIGSEAYNQGLSERRAQSVADYMASLGIESSRMRTVGFGETRPIAPNDTEDGRALNRRVELKPQS
jgi:OOP family OmpA-OmpF porin